MNRRHFIITTGVTTAAALAGCLSGDDNGDDTDNGDTDENGESGAEMSIRSVEYEAHESIDSPVPNDPGAPLIHAEPSEEFISIVGLYEIENDCHEITYEDEQYDADEQTLELDMDLDTDGDDDDACETGEFEEEFAITVYFDNFERDGLEMVHLYLPFFDSPAEYEVFPE